MPQIEVTFDIDANGIVHVTAKDVATGKEQRIAITASSGLDKSEVDRMVKDAQAHAAEDKTRRELIDARNQADALAYSAEKTLTDNRAKVEVGTASALESAIASLREAVKGDDLAAIKNASEAVQRTSHAVAEQLYKAQASQGGGGGGGNQGSGRESDVVDGEVVEV
jgi:molecular chaperone DnaK